MRLKKRFVALAALIGAIAAISTVAFAANPHFKQGQTPTCTFSATTLQTDTVSCSGGTLAGLGNTDVGYKITGGGFATFTCTNQGGTAAAGQNKAPVSVTPQETIIAADQIKNGNLALPNISSTVPTPQNQTGQNAVTVAGCPNKNWTGVASGITLTSFTLTISQPPGTPIITCTATSSTGFTAGQTVTPTCTAV